MDKEMKSEQEHTIHDFVLAGENMKGDDVIPDDYLIVGELCAKCGKGMWQHVSGAANEKEVWSRDTQEEPFKKYASIRIHNDDSAMTLCLGGHCATMTIEQWHEMAMEKCCDPA